MNRLLFISTFLSFALSAQSCALFEEAQQTTPPDAGQQSDAEIEMDAGMDDSGNSTSDATNQDASGGDMGIPRGCGDGELDRMAEECDDGNLRSHDGCSSGCTVETLAWNELERSFSRSRFTTAMAYIPDDDRIIGFGGQVERDGPPSATTFEINQGDWFEIATQTSPPAMTDHAMAYCEAAGGIILFGGILSNGQISDETWLFDGDDWQQLNPTNSPPGRDSHAMTSFADGVALYGGNSDSGKLDDLWIFDGTDWRDMPSTGPGPRSEHAMTSTGSTTPTLLLSGGFNEDGSGLLADSWVWTSDDGWNTTLTNPGGVARHSLASAADGVYLFGGFRRNDNISSEMWRFDGTTWEEVPIAANWPGFRQESAMVSTGDRIIMYGGHVATVPFGDIWEFRDTQSAQWNQLAGSEWPVGRQDFGMAYDPSRNQVLLFGGESIRSPTSHGDTWTWRPSDGWREVINSGFPRRQDMVAEFLPSRNAVLMHGGIVDVGTAAEESDTWIFDGTEWTSIASGSFDVALQDAAIAWNASDETLYMYGGERANGYSSDIYRWDETVSGGSWVEIDVGAIRPDRRTVPGMVADPSSGSLVVFGGFNEDGWLDELMTFDGASWGSTSISPLPSARGDFGFGVHGFSDELVIHGGSSTNSNDLDDLWVYRQGAWSPLAFARQPSARSGQALVWADSMAGMMLFGGYRFGAGVTAQSDLWVLRYESNWPTEICDDGGEDEDQDGLTDCDDPDCLAACNTPPG